MNYLYRIKLKDKTTVYSQGYLATQKLISNLTKEVIEVEMLPAYSHVSRTQNELADYFNQPHRQGMIRKLEGDLKYVSISKR